jgi:hypothetical protein
MKGKISWARRQTGSTASLFLFSQISAAIFCLIVSGQSAVSHLDQATSPNTIENPESPRFSGPDAPELLFREDLSIPLAGRRYCFDVDQAGNIYLLEALQGEITVYDRDGKGLRQFGKMGQGPGEFGHPVGLAIGQDQKVYIPDRTRKAVHVFDLAGNFLETKVIPGVGAINNLVVDPEGYLYLQEMRNLFALQDKDRLRRKVAGLSRLTKYDGGVEKVRDICEWDNRFAERAKESEFFTVLYHDIFYFQVDKKSRLYSGDSARYEIVELAPDGRQELIIRKKAARIQTTEKDRLKSLKKFPELKEAKMAKTKPFFLDFHILKGIGLLVGTYEDEWNESETIVCDLFDQDGGYIAKVRAPLYYYKDYDLISEQRNRQFKDGRCFSIIYDEKADALKLVRHIIECRWPAGEPLTRPK